jgi:hypothetical protein
MAAGRESVGVALPANLVGPFTADYLTMGYADQRIPHHASCRTQG